MRIINCPSTNRVIIRIGRFVCTICYALRTHYVRVHKMS